MNKIVNKIKEKLKKLSYTTTQVASKAKGKVSYTTKEKLTDAKDFTNESLSSPLLPESSTITSTVIKEQELSIVASREDLKNLELSDLVIMAYMSYDHKSFKYFFERDAFTLPDPFKDPENYLYYLFAEKNNHSHIISMVIIRKNASIEKNIWYKIMGNDMVMLDLSHEQANEIKVELMPKDTNNFYPFRKNGKILGCIMFAYQICDLKNEFEEIKT
jgi:hypothetical protein